MFGEFTVEGIKRLICDRHVTEIVDRSDTNRYTKQGTEIHMVSAHVVIVDQTFDEVIKELGFTKRS